MERFLSFRRIPPYGKCGFLTWKLSQVELCAPVTPFNLNPKPQPKTKSFGNFQNILTNLEAST